MRFIFIIILCLLSYSTQLHAEGEGASYSTAEDAMGNMMKMLDSETAIATKTKMNADYVPGMVSVLQAREVEAMGITNVNEALTLVPGITNSRDTAGATVVNVRGTGSVFGVGKLL